MNSDINLSEINSLYKSGRHKEALALLQAEEQKTILPVDGYILKAGILGMLGRYKEAVEVADKVLEKEKNNYGVYNSKAVSLYHMGDYKGAVEAFDKCLVLNPNFHNANHLKIYCLIYLGKFSEAAETLEKSDMPELLDEIWYNNLGYMYLCLNNLRKAQLFLYGAKVLDPYLPIIYLNISRIWKLKGDKKRFIKHRLMYWFLSFLDGIKILERIKPKRSFPRPHISEANFYYESGRLFASDPQVRETKSILKILRGPNRAALCNDTWEWFAVNIPYNAVEENGFKGDIDIILKRPRFMFNHDAGFTYRGFQVKTILIDRNGNAKSVKRGNPNHYKIKKQLNLLKKFGCEQIFLLEIYVIERHHSSYHTFPSKEISKEIKEKAEYLKESGYGYVVMAEEPLTSHSDETGGVFHFPINILQAKAHPISPSFQKLVDGIDIFKKNFPYDKFSGPMHNKFRAVPQIVYCINCKNLAMITPDSLFSYYCFNCGDRFC